MTFFLYGHKRIYTFIRKYKSNPEVLTKVINKFLTPMTDLIMKMDGTIDKYMELTVLWHFGMHQ